MASPVVDFLKSQCALLSDIPDAELATLAAASEFKSFKAGQTVLFRGEAVDGLYVVQGGSVQVWAKPPKEKETIKVADLGPGQFFGEMSILEETTAGATIKGGEQGAQVILVPQQAFLDLIAQRPDVKAKLVAVIESRKPAPKG